MKNVYIRRFLLFFLCFSMLISLAFPSYASETTDTGTFLSVSLPAENVAPSIMIGLGVLPGEDPEEYKNVVQRCIDYLIEQGRVINGKIEVWQREQVGDYSLWKYGVDVSMLDVIRSWLFSEKIVENSYSISGDFSSLQQNLWYLFYDRAYSFTGTEGGISYIGGSSYPLYFTDGTLSADYPNTSSRSEYLASNSTSPVQFRSINLDTCNIYEKGQYTGVDAMSALTLGTISPSTVALDDAYKTWFDNAIAVPIPGTDPGTDEDVVVVPIAPGQTIDDTISIPQEDVWVGDGSYVDSPAVPETGTLSDILSAVLSLPQAIVGSITQALSNFFGFSGTADAYAISLTDFFPFCIPFDIYEFLSVLSAAPEAPVFHWVIPVPQLGRTFDIDIDLSPWDPVAAVFRTFELLAFIVGLGMITREKFLRS